MKILLYDNSGHPFQVQLSRSLAKNGFNVHHVFSASFQTPKGSLEIDKLEDPEGFTIKGISLPTPFEKYSFLKRWQQENQFGKLVVAEIDNYKPDILLASNVPLDTLKHVVKYCKQNGIIFIFWVQDFYGIAIQKILKSKIPLIGNLIGRYYTFLEKLLLEKSDHIILIANEFISVLKLMKVSNKNFTVIPNWSPVDKIPVESKENDWSVEHKLNDKFCFLYTGTLGLKHDPRLLLELAIAFKENVNARVVVISQGIGAEWLKREMGKHHLNNLIILDFQPFELLSKVMATADVLISILEKDAGIYSVPSKILSYMCAQRALLLSVPKENLSSKIVAETKSGLTVSPGDVQDFVIAAEVLYRNKDMRETMGVNARRYAEENFRIETKTDIFVQIINNSIHKAT